METSDSRFQTVLVVDDDERLLASFASYLGRNRVALTATTGDTACELARQHKPDLAIIDLQLRSESGIDLIRRIKEENPATVVVMISGYGSVEATVRAMRAGADDVLVKPVTWEEIVRRLEEEPDSDLSIETPTLARAQWEHVHRVLSDCDGNVSMAARRLGMDRSTLQRWLRRPAPSA
jgi:two-component system response regulator RegA